MSEEIKTAGSILAQAIMNEDISKFRIDGYVFQITWYSSELLPNLTKDIAFLTSNALDLDDFAVSLRREEDFQVFEVDYSATEIRDAINANGVWKIGEDDGIEILMEKPFNTPEGEIKHTPARPRL